MNCILFDEPPPFKLDESDPRLAHVLGCLKIPEGGEIFAGKINSFMCVARIRYLRGAGALLEPLRPLPDPRPKNITFCAAFTRPQIAQRILFECSCFGVKNVIFYAAQKGDASYLKSGLYESGKYAEWLLKGAQQACASSVPKFFRADSLEDCLKTAAELEPEEIPAMRIAPDVYEAETNMKKEAEKFSAGNFHATIAIGGERGFGESERDALRARGYSLASFGPRVLRTDTAAIAALSLFACG